MIPYQQNARAIVKSKRPPIMPPTIAPLPDIGEPINKEESSKEKIRKIAMASSIKC
jgi:hypothetical protein